MVTEFNTRGTHTYTIDEGTQMIHVKLWGERGQNGSGVYNGANGGIVECDLDVSGYDEIEINIGIGGGNGPIDDGYNVYVNAGDGGGACDIRPVDGGLTTRFVVAGGGGGAGDTEDDENDQTGPPGDGGGLVADSAPDSSGGSGATQESAGSGGDGRDDENSTGNGYGGDGSFGSGGGGGQNQEWGSNREYSASGGGGGGGWYGGGGGGAAYRGYSGCGGGGSSYASFVATNVTFEKGGSLRSVGKVTIEEIEPPDTQLREISDPNVKMDGSLREINDL